MKLITNTIKIIDMLRVASVFSGIGAFEMALKQMQIDHEIVFACDNGERYLKFPIDRLHDLCMRLGSNNRRLFIRKLWEVNKSVLKKKEITFDMFSNYVLSNTGLSGKYELPVDCIKILTKGLSKEKREQYVNSLYELTGKVNLVKKSYMENYELAENNWHEDIRFLDGKKYADNVDILVGGSPCQSFSTYGKKLGLKDTRGTLFYDYARIIKEIKPKVFIYENVSGLLTHDGGNTWNTMLSVWNSLGYKVKYEKLNAVDYDHPQTRVRLFLVGIRENVYTHEYQFPPKRKNLTKKSSDFLDQSPVDDKYYLGQKGFEWVTDTKKNKNKTRYNRDIIGCQTANQQFNWIGDLLVESPAPNHRKNPNIYIGHINGEEKVARKMTPAECLRLMGFGDSFKIVVDDKVAYRQAGNSIVVPVLKEIIKSIESYL